MKKLTVLHALLFLCVALTFGQKLPKVQTSSVRAPANIKFGGKTTEWNDQFQAYNNGNHMYYTLSNDDKNLYLTARMEDIAGDAKIFKGGLTFTILSLANKANKLSFTFPVISRQKRVEMGDGGGNHLVLYKTLMADTLTNKTKIDSLIATSNSEIKKDYKQIYITGIPEMSDPLLSIYNTQGIMVGAGFDKRMRYTYELAIPLKYLDATISNLKSVRYNIRLNVLPVDAAKNSSGGQHFDKVVFPSTPVPVSIDDLFSYNDTDFSGVYTLALKP